MSPVSQAKHLQKYIAKQDTTAYTPVEQATWRFIMRLLKNFLKEAAHPFYEEGLKKSGISVEKIPSIDEMGSALQESGWRTVPVSGFLPPTAFLEMQSLGLLPVAKEIRTVEHIPYTPAPDIVHEAAGHAPFLSHPDYTEYLHRYAEIANKSIISSEDIMLYQAIRKLSDLKEHPESTQEEIDKANQELEEAAKSVSFVSEANKVSRLYWWTAEYGLVGSLDNPKLYGAGLLSSIGEAKECLSDKVKKIPLSIECTEYDYDITEPQPQLFVVKDFKDLHRVLDELADTFSFRRGGEFGLKEAMKSKIVNTVELDSGLQISGILENYFKDKNDTPVFIKMKGPTQLAYNRSELSGHNKEYHEHGYSTVVDTLKDGTSLVHLSQEDLASHGIREGEDCDIEFQSGIHLKGKLKKILTHEGKNLVFTFENCSVNWDDKELFKPDWGIFDLGIGANIPSVFGGPADSQAFGDVEDFAAILIPKKPYTEEQKKVHALYQEIRDARNAYLEAKDKEKLEQEVKNLYKKTQDHFPNEWLAKMELYELTFSFANDDSLKGKLKKELEDVAKKKSHLSEHIHDGLALADSLKI